MPDAYDQIRRNLASHVAWPHSFCGRLAEDGVWDIAEFWSLHASLVQIGTTASASSSIDRWLAQSVNTIQQRVLQAVRAHYDSNDQLKIVGVEAEELYELVERFEHAAAGVYSGENLPETSFDLTGPCMRDA